MILKCIVTLTLAAGLCAEPPRLPRKAPHQLGRAVWYGLQFHGQMTASGEIYDMFSLTAAHRELPLGSVVKVTNLTNERAIIVRINDRGPFGNAHRIIDLSYAASRYLGMHRSGHAPVRLERIQ
jgi:rare lipoprotein A